MLATQLFALSPVDTSSLTVTPGFRELTLAWDAVESSEDTETHFYVVYRSEVATESTGPARIAINRSNQRVFSDKLLNPGSSYKYIVMSGTDAASVDAQDPAELDWAEAEVYVVPTVGTPNQEGDPVASPHLGESVEALSKDSCRTCHITHDSANAKLIESSGNPNHSNLVNALCADCHESDSVQEKEFVTSLISVDPQISGHTVLTTGLDQGERELECITCHSPHQDSSKPDASLLPNRVFAFGVLSTTEDSATLSVNAENKSALCVTCHDDEQTWWTAFPARGAYPTSPVVDENAAPEYRTFPARGSFPGMSSAQNASTNGHAKIFESTGRDQGDCRYCHTSHASNNPYAALLHERGQYRAMTAVESLSDREDGKYASFCLSCHNASNEGTAWRDAVDIASLVSLPATATIEEKAAFATSNAGHRVSSANALVLAGSALPCYTCHAAHGSLNNSKNLRDDLGSNLNGNRMTCFACHTSSDGFILAADGISYESTATASMSKIIGLDRSGIDLVGEQEVPNKLLLPNVSLAHASTSTTECSTCHGNIHAPANVQEGSEGDMTPGDSEEPTGTQN